MHKKDELRVKLLPGCRLVHASQAPPIITAMNGVLVCYVVVTANAMSFQLFQQTTGVAALHASFVTPTRTTQPSSRTLL
jgi:hypothetical protein